MARQVTNTENYSAIANAIREKSGTTDTYKPSEMAQAISAIEVKDNTDLIKLIDRSITTANIPEGTTKIGAKAFANCDSLISVTIPESVTVIGGEAFSNSTVKEVTFPSSLKTIAIYGFSGCKNLKEIQLPTDTALSIDHGAFYNTGLESITIPANVTNCSYQSFGGCANLKRVVIEGNGTGFERYTFLASSNIEEIVFPQDFGSVLNVSSSTKLTVKSLEAMIDALGVAPPEANKTLTLGATNLEKISDEYKAIANSKNWTLA